MKPVYFLTKKIFTLLLILLSLFTAHYSLFPSPVKAVCPICTVAVGAGLGLSRYLGIDDSISGIWVGGLMISLTLWTADWLKKKKWKILKKITIKYLYCLSFVFYLLITYPPLIWSGVIGHPFNTILGIDKLVFGSLIGFGTFILGVYLDKKVRKIKGHQLFNYQKVAFPVVSLLIASLVVYFFGGYLY